MIDNFLGIDTDVGGGGEGGGGVGVMILLFFKHMNNQQKPLNFSRQL